MSNTARTLLQALLSGVAREAGKDLYQLIKEYVLALPKEQQTKLVATSFTKPDAFLTFELDRVSHQSALVLSSMPPPKRAQLIELARTKAKDEQQTILELLYLVRR
jgi:hypothetical protein